jgi:hypothetical protein
MATTATPAFDESVTAEITGLARTEGKVALVIGDRLRLQKLGGSGCMRMTSNSLNECGGSLAPTKGWRDRSQNCLHDMRIVGNTELIWNG